MAIPRICRWLLCISAIFFVSNSNASLVDDITMSLRAMDDCASCRDTLGQFQTIASLGDDTFISTFIELCDALGTEDPDVCSGTFTMLGPIIAHDLRQINVTGKTAGGLCDALFGQCSTSVATPFRVPLPPPPKQSPHTENQGTPTVRKKPFQVVHISDVHIDREYTVGADANCTKNICCRFFADEVNKTVSVPAQPNGNNKCDSPVSLADSMLEAVNDINPEFVIFTGDVVEGATWLIDKTEVEADLTAFNSELLSKIKARIFPAIGNHDSAPVNSFTRTTTKTANNSQWVFDTQSAGWDQWIGETAAREVLHNSGSYSALVPGTRLRILSVNTQFWYKQNLWLYDSDVFQPDPNGILAFMAQQLQLAENAGEKVWIIGHIPLGKEDTSEDQSNYYDQILQRYKSTIAGHFFGHSHKDQFEIAYSNYSDQTAANAVSVALIAPALTPTSGNPAFKLYDVDPDTFGVMDARVIFSNISDPTFQVKPKWSEFYSARKTYGPLVGLAANSELTPAFWHNLTEVFTANDTAFQMWNTFLSRAGAVSPCDGDCRDVSICDMRAFRSENNCDTPNAGPFSKRFENGAVQETSECEGLGLGSLLSRMAHQIQLQS